MPNENEYSRLLPAKETNNAVLQTYNVVADGWAGAYNSRPPTYTDTHNRRMLSARFLTLHFNQHKPMDGQTNGRTDRQNLSWSRESATENEDQR